MGRVRVFVSYDQLDESLRLELDEHLASLEAGGLITYWHAGLVAAGEDLAARSAQELNAAQVVLLLVSASFMNSDACREEMNIALARRAANGVAVIPVMVRDVYLLEGSPLAGLRRLPRDATSIITSPSRDRAWKQVAEAVATRKGLRLEAPQGAADVTTEDAPPTPWGPVSDNDWCRLAKLVEGRLRLIESEENWSDYVFDLEAEVEAEIAGKGQRRQLKRIASLQKALEQSAERLILVEGEPGSGKSVSLRRLGLSLATQASSPARPVVPLYVNLRDLEIEPGMTVDGALLRMFVRERFVSLEPRNRAYLERCFDLGLESGRWVFLLDSFDEIPEVLSSGEPDDVVRRYAKAVHNFAYSLHDCRVVVASRPYRGPGAMPWPRFRLLPLSLAGLRAVVQVWFSDQDAAHRVLGELADAEFAGWAHNPLLLSLLCEHRQADGRLPETAQAAFESFVQRRMGKRKDVLERQGLTVAQLRDSAEQVAFLMTADPRMGLAPKVEDLRSAARGGGAEPALPLDRALIALIQLRLARGPTEANALQETFSFFHRRLQEYFATRHVLDGRRAVPPDVLLTDERWRETAVTLLQFGDPARLKPVLLRAVALLEAHVATLRRADADFGPLLDEPPCTAEEISRAHASRNPIEFPWPRGSLHLLGILGGVRRGSAIEHKSLSKVLRRARRSADLILLTAVCRGVRPDQAAVIELSGAATPHARSVLLTWACSLRSDWLEELAIAQASLLPSLPPEVLDAVHRMLLMRELTGALHSEPTRTEVQLRRIDRTGALLRAARRLRWVRPIDAACLFGLVALHTALEGVERPDSLASLVDSGYLLRVLLFRLAGAAYVYAMTAPWFLNVLGPRDPKASAWYLAKLPTTTQDKARVWGAAGGDAIMRMAAIVVTPTFVANYIAFDRLAWTGPSIGYLALPILLFGSFRPGAYLAARLGLLGSPSWLLAGALPLAVLAYSFRKGHWWRVAVVAVLLTTLAIVVTAAATVGALVGMISFLQASTMKFILGLFLFVAVIVPMFALATFKLREVLAWVDAFKMRDGIDARQLLEFAARIRFGTNRVRFLRWVREQGRLRPTRNGERILKHAILAIERDARQRVAWWRPAANRNDCAPDASWSTEFAVFYREHFGGRRRGMSDWGGTLDELGRLCAQLRLLADQRIGRHDPTPQASAQSRSTHTATESNTTRAG